MNNKLQSLENNQIWLYFISLLLGAVSSVFLKDLTNDFSVIISPAIAVLLFNMFAQIPFLEMKKAFSNLPYFIALLIGNFIFVPIAVWTLLQIVDFNSYIAFSIALVLLSPCIDYVIVFTKLGRGNEALMLVSTPILLVLQLLLLPLYMYLFFNNELSSLLQLAPLFKAFLWMIVIPMAFAFALQVTAKSFKLPSMLLKQTAWLPVPLMAAVLFTILATQLPTISEHFGEIKMVIPIFVLFLIIAPLIGKFLSVLFRLPSSTSRTLAFSLSTRNSLVVLPIALALPGQWAIIAAAVIVTQTIIELIGELIYVKIIPKLFQ